MVRQGWQPRGLQVADAVLVVHGRQDIEAAKRSYQEEVVKLMSQRSMRYVRERLLAHRHIAIGRAWT